MANLFRRMISSLGAGWHRLAGRVCFHMRMHDRARRHFKQVLRGGDDFVAYVYLARLAHGAGDSAGYRRELSRARRTAPQRMARMRLLEDPNETDYPLSEETGERATWRAFRLSSVGRSEDFEPSTERGLSSCPGGEIRRFGDDFSSSEERLRFSDLPPIRREDIERVDLDELAAGL